MTTKQKIKQVVLDNLLIIFMIFAIIIGVGLGMGLRSTPGWEYYQKRKIFYLKFPGDLLLSMLNMLILPLLVSILVSTLAGLTGKASGRMGLRAVLYYLTTTLTSIILGIILVLSIQPGNRGDQDIDKTGKAKHAAPLDAFFDFIRNCFPNNLVTACFQTQETVVGNYTYKVPIEMEANSTDNMTMFEDRTVDSPSVETANRMNLLGLVVFSIFFGAILAKLGHAGKSLLNFFESMRLALMELIKLVIWYSPVGIIFLVAAKIVEMKDPATVFTQLGYYVATVLVGLGIHGFIILPLIYLIVVRKNPYFYMYRMVNALLTAWGTASSSATLPVTMECLENRNKVDPRITKFVVPVGTAVNKDGTALYEAVASIFIAQVNNIPLNVGQIITVGLTSAAATIGSAGVPSAGLVTMAIVLSAVGLPPDGITLILAIDWFVDRFRTAINVLGDSYGAGIVQHLSRADLAEADRLTEQLN